MLFLPNFYAGACSLSAVSVFALGLLYQQNSGFSWSSASASLVFLTCVVALFVVLTCPTLLFMVGGVAAFTTLVLMSENAFLFYFSFESVLIPTLVLILGFGDNPERLGAGVAFLLYTVTASLPLLLVLVSEVNRQGTAYFGLMSGVASGVFALVLYGAFLVKLPMFGVHFWLPKAHVEAPLAGSILLAGVLLKLGGYGMILMNSIFSVETGWILSLSLWGGVCASVCCVQQTDMKAFVAYSSVGHMAVVIAVTVLDTSPAEVAAIWLMFAHGLSSPAMFILASAVSSKTNSRALVLASGVGVVFPVLSLFVFVFSALTSGVPPSLNFLGEGVAAISLGQTTLCLVVLGVMVFQAGCYCMYFWSVVSQGVSATTQFSSVTPHDSLVFFLVPYGLTLCPNVLV